MKTEDFEKIVNHRIEKLKELLKSKGKEYIRNGDKLHNFKRAAQLRNSNPLQALQGMLDKHLVSWLDIVDDIEKKETEHLDEKLIDEKLGDIITYFVLAECVIKDHLKKK